MRFDLKRRQGRTSHDMKFKVVISAPYFQPVLSEYRHVFDAHDIEVVVPEVHERLSEEELLQCLPDADGIMCGDDRITERVLAACPKLRVIAKWGTGIDSIDRDAAAKRGIPVKNTPNAFTDAVADLVLGFLLCFAKKIPWADEQVRAGEWMRKQEGTALNECTLGLLGLGNIGKAVASRARAFGMTILGFDALQPSEEFLKDTGTAVVTLEELLARSDFLSLHCTLNESTRHILNRERLALMKPTAIVVNTARGALIDETALIEALTTGKISGAGLDVFEVEQLPAESPLRKLPNVLLSPHNANASPSAWKRVHENTLKNLLEGLGVLEAKLLVHEGHEA